jgi:hypothetical protein
MIFILFAAVILVISNLLYWIFVDKAKQVLRREGFKTTFLITNNRKILQQLRILKDRNSKYEKIYKSVYISSVATLLVIVMVIVTIVIFVLVQ